MLRRKLLLATIAFAAPLAGLGEARAQANLTPDPTPRLPPQPGQGLPVEDVRFLHNAFLLSTAEVVAAGKAEQAGDAELQRFATGLAARHRRLTEQISALARQRQVDPAAPPGGVAGGDIAAARQRLESLGGGAARDFLAAQIEVHAMLVEMYQTEASQTTDRELGRFAITTLVELQEDFATAARLGQPHGLRPPERMLRNAPQYGPGAGPSR